MTGPEHYEAAEQQLAEADNYKYGSARETYHLTRAQVHATLAQAAAVSMLVAQNREEPRG